MKYEDGRKRLQAYRRQIAALRGKMRKVQAGIAPEPVGDYELAASSGPVRLSHLFGSKSELFVIHNMGSACPYCTLWADGFNGIYHHLADRAGFAVVTPDPVPVQKRFAKNRGWRFPMASHAGSSFAEDMGYRGENGGWLPGISVFRRERGRILRVSDARFSPGDDFCTMWHILDLLPEGEVEWAPKFKYA